MNNFSQLSKLTGAVALVLAGSCAFISQAYADDLYLGSNYIYPVSMIEKNGSTVNTVNEGAGPIGLSTFTGTILGNTFNNTPINPVYCVDLFHNVGVPSNWPNATVSTAGVINGLSVNNAGEVAYILDTIAPQATTTTQEAAVQALIWTTIYDGSNSPTTYVDGNKVTADSNASYYSSYTGYLAELGSHIAALDTVAWVTPDPVNKNVQGQAFALPAPVAPLGGGVPVSPVPVPAALFFVGPALVGLFGGLRRKSA